ncbi:MAG TPA: class I SAM-dependent methyltransferase [Bacteroidia bacterium]|jgi:23S rRNA (cytosine1962-C5)-methyltransferase|nr:class I SAM-dependent methyltransferase [Bacteroidia bacterium]
MQLLTPKNWKDYELLDAGDFEKLERFGQYITIRPEPQAVWRKQWSNADWEKQAHVKFISKSSSAGDWKKFKQMPEQWRINYECGIKNSELKNIQFRLGLTSFKHVGVFPEQAVNWDAITTFISKIEKPKFLNLFAYTGGASLAARAAGADVTHVDSIKQVVTWANENMQLSKLDNIRWMVDDALKFVKKEVRRGNTYHGIILDPPAYGHGPNGEKWKLEDNISEMMQEVLKLVDPVKHLLILNAYSLGFSGIIIENLLRSDAKKLQSGLQTGELYLQAKSGIKLPLGVWGRLIKE